MPFRILRLLCTVVLVIFISACARAQQVSGQQNATLTVTFSGLHSDSGKVCVRLWNKKDGFPTDDSKALRVVTVEIVHGVARAVFADVPFGSYAVSSWHDENANGKFDTRFPGIPVEGYGISNGTRGRFGPPAFQPSVFAIAQPQMLLPIRIEY